MLKIFLVSALLLLVGCASVPMASMQDDLEAKKFMAPADKSRLYVYRDESFGSAIKIAVTVDGRLLGQTAPKSYFVVDLPPGEHTLMCMGESNSILKLKTQKGQAHYIWQEMKMGAFSAGCALREVDKTDGQKGVLACKRALSSL